MKKFLAVMLVLAMLSMVMTACSEPAENEDTSADTAGDTAGNTESDAAGDSEGDKETETEGDTGTDTDTSGDEDIAEYDPNMFPYEGDVIPGSVEYEWGAPDMDSVFFPIDESHVIHDGKGTWGNSVNGLPIYVFDNDFGTFYDCDENCEAVNTDEMNVGIVLENWNDDPTKTGYVGAWIEEGVIISQIRFFARNGSLERVLGGTFQASVDGTEWVDLHIISEIANEGLDYEFVDIDDDTVYYYVRYVSRDDAKFQEYGDLTLATYYQAYCNIAEMEIWGTPAK